MSERRPYYVYTDSYFEGHLVTECYGSHDTLVFSDSILKHCRFPNHADLCAIRGATSQTLINKVRVNDINWKNYA